MAALGALTADCLGTVDPRAFEVASDGALRPTFSSCSATRGKMDKILQLLSLQQRGAHLPFVKECMAGRFELARKQFADSGITTCPTWTKSHVINPISHSTIALAETSLPTLPAGRDVQPLLVATGETRSSQQVLGANSFGAEDDPAPLTVFDLLEENSLYVVAGDVEGQNCGSPAACAAACAAAFPRFVIATKGENSIVTDPVAWLLDVTYATAPEDPYLRATYYHPMSYYGGVPGMVFGAPERAQPCAAGVSCPPELCSYWAGAHIKTKLQLDCLVPGDWQTCASYCGPPLP